VSAAASAAVHFAGQGYGVRMLLDDRPATWTSPHSGEASGVLLDAMATVSSARTARWPDALAQLRRGGGDGIVVAVLGEVGEDEAMGLARLGREGVPGVALPAADDVGTAHAARPRGRSSTTPGRRRPDPPAAMAGRGGGPERTVTQAWEDAVRRSQDNAARLAVARREDQADEPGGGRAPAVAAAVATLLAALTLSRSWRARPGPDRGGAGDRLGPMGLGIVVRHSCPVAGGGRRQSSSSSSRSPCCSPAVSHGRPSSSVRAVDRFRGLIDSAMAITREQRPPVESSQGIVLLVVASIGLVAVAVDLLAASVRQPALAGLPLLAVYCVPAALLPGGLPWYYFVAAAAGFLLLLSADAGDRIRAWGGCCRADAGRACSGVREPRRRAARVAAAGSASSPSSSRARAGGRARPGRPAAQRRGRLRHRVGRRQHDPDDQPDPAADAEPDAGATHR
jgi:hypothetical protein